MRCLIGEAYQRIRQTIEANREKLQRGAKVLIERETLYAEELDDVMAGKVVALESSARPANSAEIGIEAAVAPGAPAATREAQAVTVLSHYTPASWVFNVEWLIVDRRNQTGKYEVKRQSEEKR